MFDLRRRTKLLPDPKAFAADEIMSLARLELADEEDVVRSSSSPSDEREGFELNGLALNTRLRVLCGVAVATLASSAAKAVIPMKFPDAVWEDKGLLSFSWLFNFKSESCDVDEIKIFKL